MQERWLSVDEIAAHLGVNPETIYKWIDRKKLPAHKVGRLWKFKASQVDEWVLAGKVAQESRKVGKIMGHSTAHHAARDTKNILARLGWKDRG